jgi:hypothetical protein
LSCPRMGSRSCDERLALLKLEIVASSCTTISFSSTTLQLSGPLGAFCPVTSVGWLRGALSPCDPVCRNSRRVEGSQGAMRLCSAESLRAGSCDVSGVRAAERWLPLAWPAVRLACRSPGLPFAWSAVRLACRSTGLPFDWPAVRLACRSPGLPFAWPAVRLACLSPGLPFAWPAVRLACCSPGLPCLSTLM